MSVDRKRKQSDPPAGKKKKKENGACDPVVREVVEDTRAAVEDMMKELNNMVEPSTSPPEYIVPYAQDPPSSGDILVCPCHNVRLEARESQKGWKYVKCPIQPCLLFCGQDQAVEYMKAVYSQPHAEVMDMWTCLQCFCREPATLQQSHSTQNPDRLFLNCPKKTCGFFRWADQPLGPKYWSWFHDHPPKKADQQAVARTQPRCSRISQAWRGHPWPTPSKERGSAPDRLRDTIVARNSRAQEPSRNDGSPSAATPQVQ